MALHSFNYVYLNLNLTYNYTKLLYSTNVELSIVHLYIQIVRRGQSIIKHIYFLNILNIYNRIF